MIAALLLPVIAAASTLSAASSGQFTYQFQSRVEDWRASVTVRWLVRRFRTGPQSRSHGRVSSPRSPNPAWPFPAPGSPVRFSGVTSPATWLARFGRMAAD